MTKKMTSERLFQGEKEGKVIRVKSWHGKESSNILFKYGSTLYHNYSTIYQGDGNIVNKLSTKNPEDIEDDFSKLVASEISSEILKMVA